MVIYGILTETDVAKLFIAGVIPGLLLMTLYMVTTWLIVLKDPSKGRPAECLPFAEKVRALRGSWAVLALFLIVLGGMYVGVFTPTEGAGMGAAGAFLFMLMRRRKLGAAGEALVEAGRTTAALFLVACGRSSSTNS
jgi:C4-dicarboxylate transporter, DctM subunit